VILNKILAYHRYFFAIKLLHNNLHTKKALEKNMVLQIDALWANAKKCHGDILTMA
jgi:hypothetical protein